MNKNILIQNQNKMVTKMNNKIATLIMSLAWISSVVLLKIYDFTMFVLGYQMLHYEPNKIIAFCELISILFSSIIIVTLYYKIEIKKQRNDEKYIEVPFEAPRPGGILFDWLQD